MGKVSVIMPVFNSQKYISQAVESFLAQTWPYKELIIVDDASTDSSMKELKKYSKYFDNIVLLTNDQNRGVSYSRNRGIQVASGNYIALLDSDDWMDPTRLEKQVQFLVSHPDVSVVFSDTYLVDEVNSNIQRTETDFVSESLFLPMMLCRNVISPTPATCMYKRECFQSEKYDESLHHAEDYDLNLRLAFNFKFGYLKEPLYYYRRHSKNVSNNHGKHLDNELRIISKIPEKNIKLAFTLSGRTSKERDYIKLLQGIFELKRRKTKKAILMFESLNTYDSEILRSKHFYLGVANYLRSEFRESYRHFLQALNCDENPETLNNIGVTLIQLGADLSEAIVYFEKALQMKPEYLDTRHNLLKCSSGEKDGLKLTERELRKSLIPYK